MAVDPADVTAQAALRTEAAQLRAEYHGRLPDLWRELLDELVYEQLTDPDRPPTF